MNKKYIYGIIRTDGNGNGALGINGLGGSAQVDTITYRGLGCALSDYSGREFNSMSKEELIRFLLAHQVVVEHVMKKHTVLPVKFGTLLATPEEARCLLAQGYSQFVDALSWFQDKVEIEVAATWDTEQVLQEISSEEGIVRTRQAIAKSPGQQTLEERILLGQMVKASMDRHRDSYRERMISFLKPAAVDLQPNALLSDQMVMSVAFLVEKANQKEFDNRINELNDLFHNQINFRIIGPLPPYSFITVEVTRLRLEQIEEAKQLLHLGGVISEPEVRKAYRHLAAETHPDRKPGDEMAKTRFAKLRQASELLTACCRGQAESDGNLLINIKCPRDEEIQQPSFAEIASLAGAANG